MSKPKPASEAQLWTETAVGCALMALGGYLLARGVAPWYAGVAIVFMGGVFVNKMRAVAGLTEVGKLIRIWKWGNGGSDDD